MKVLAESAMEAEMEAEMAGDLDLLQTDDPCEAHLQLH